MNMRYGIFSVLLILALVSMTGVCAAEENADHNLNSVDPGLVPTPSAEMNLPRPLPNDTHGRWAWNWTGNMTDGNRTTWEGVNPDCDGMFGAESPFYGLKLAFENLDESFTFNRTERLEKEIDHGENRLLELDCELAQNRTTYADHLLDLYREKMNETGDAIGPLEGNDTGLLHAREMIEKHRLILENLSAEHPDNRGLENAFRNSEELRLRFDEKILRHFNQTGEGNATAFAKLNTERGNGQGHMDNETNQTPFGQEKRLSNENGNGQFQKNNGQGDNQNDRNGQQQNPGQNNNQPQNTGPFPQQNSGKNGRNR